MAQHTIIIEVVPKKAKKTKKVTGWEIKVERKTARYKDGIKWVCQSPLGPAPFVVFFGPKGPMESSFYGHFKPKGTVKYNAKRYGSRVFKYTVAVCLFNAIRVLDPDLEIVP